MFKQPFKTKNDIINELLAAGLLSSTLVCKSFIQAEKSHMHHTRDAGGSYLNEHIFPIVSSVAHRYKGDDRLESLVVIAFLHDVVEDDDLYTIQDCEHDFGAYISTMVSLLTKPQYSSPQSHTQKNKMDVNALVVKNLMNADKCAQIVKLEDRLNNISCINSIDKNPKYVRCIKETQLLFVPLAQVVSKVYVDLLEEQVYRLKSEITL